MYSWLLVLIAHSAWRWVVIATGFAVLVSAVTRLRSGAPWGSDQMRLARFFSISLDIQVLMGAALYLSLSPLTTTVFAGAGSQLPADSDAHFMSVLHPIIMVAAFIAVHIASVVVRRTRAEPARTRRALIFYGITWLIVLAGIPWWRPWLRL